MNLFLHIGEHFQFQRILNKHRKLLVLKRCVSQHILPVGREWTQLMVLQLVKSIFDIFPAAARLYLSVCPTSTVGSSYNPTLCICHKPCQKYLLSLQKLTGKWRLVDFPLVKTVSPEELKMLTGVSRQSRVNMAALLGVLRDVTGSILCHH